MKKQTNKGEKKMETMKETFEAMKVAELREESRKRGLTLESKGHKFNKTELIERLIKFDMEQKDIDDDIQKAIDEAGQTDTDCEGTQKTEFYKNKDGYIVFAKTLDEIEKKYSGRKKQYIYDDVLKVGCFVVFVHVVEAKNGWIGKKLRSAKVTAINRKKELVRVTTFYGCELELTFDELLFIKVDKESSFYPSDIRTFLKGQRTIKGEQRINERFGKSER